VFRGNAVITYSRPSSTVSVGIQATLTCNVGFSTTAFGNIVKTDCMWYGEWEPDINAVICEKVT